MNITLKGKSYKLVLPDEVEVPKLQGLKYAIYKLNRRIISSTVILSSGGIAFSLLEPSEPLKIAFLVTGAIGVISATIAGSAKDIIAEDLVPFLDENKSYIRDFMRRRFNILTKLEAQKKNKPKNYDFFENEQLRIVEDTLKCLLSYDYDLTQELLGFLDNKEELKEDLEDINGNYFANTVEVLSANARCKVDEDKMYIQGAMAKNMELFSICPNLLDDLKLCVDSYLRYLKNDAYFHKLYPGGTKVKISKDRYSLEWQKSLLKQQYEDEQEDREVFEEIALPKQESMNNAQIEEVERVIKKINSLYPTSDEERV